ncbi:proline-rich protein 23A3-like [Peromyscus californicus insignis]|uniref:proline-rich protein 23A3-like n=1 Tax=Peromyscus californicus insignis TaxID=564181 RepID=UPI0022A7179D|nr:proline-rich protein 23A3-like [Peromyscus californicus insignis]XP_052586750.1 proline-rich protein 23A3-like [Peromyscus californicus insignis]
MPGVRPRSPTANPLPCWAPQPEGPKPAKRLCLQQAQPDLEAPTGPASEQLTTTMFLPAGLALKLHLEDVDLLLEPEPDSVMTVMLPGHTIIVVPEDLQDSHQPGQPGFLPASHQEAALLEMPQDHQVILQRGSSGTCVADTQGCGNPSDPGEVTQGGLGDFLRPMPWMDAPAGMVPGMLLPFTGVSSPLFPGQVPCPWGPSALPGAERYAPSSIWSLKGSMLWPLPSSPLQPLPPSPPPPPPPGHQAQDPQSHQKLWRPCCKARRRLF